jgi:hypothetical protein
MRKVIMIATGVLLSLALTANIALADACENTSRAAPKPSTGPIIRGNWVWLPSVGAPVAAWGFAVPGGEASRGFGFPGANGNYTDGEEFALLGMSANCDTLKDTSRQSSNGIQNPTCP